MKKYLDYSSEEILKDFKEDYDLVWVITRIYTEVFPNLEVENFFCYNNSNPYNALWYIDLCDSCTIEIINYTNDREKEDEIIAFLGKLKIFKERKLEDWQYPQDILEFFPKLFFKSKESAELFQESFKDILDSLFLINTLNPICHH